jgi:ribosomal RNA-processing protein 8
MERKRDIKSKQKSSVTSKVAENLKSSKFRFLNEQLYCSKSDDAVQLFKDADLFADYHEGYRQQVEKWPKNPLDLLVAELKKEKYLDC